MNNVVMAIGVALIPLVFIWSAYGLIRIFEPGMLIKQFALALAAGFLLSGIAVEFIPRIIGPADNANVLMIIIAFLIGLLLMLSVERLGGGSCCSSSEHKPLMSFLLPFAIEFFINGALIGIATVTGHMMLLIVAISLSLCSFSCGLAIATRLHSQQMSAAKSAWITLFLTVLFPLGAWLGSGIISVLPVSALDVVLSFSVSVLLYLIVMDLLPGSMTSKNKWVRISFFVAFIVVIYLKLVV